MTSYKNGLTLVPPPTLEKQLETLAAARALLGREDEAARRRRDEIAALRRDFEELRRSLGAIRQHVESEVRSDVLRMLKYNADQPSVAKASPDDPQHPGWPAGTPDGRGGKFRPKDGDEGAPEAQLAGDVIRICVLMPDMSSAGTCMYWCHGGFLLGKQRNLGLGCPSLVREPG